MSIPRRLLMIRNALQRFMYGRYGNDRLNLCLMGTYLILFFLAAITDVGLFSLLGEVLLFLALFRMLSRNLAKRSEENRIFMKKATPVLQWLRLRRNILKDKEHRYFRCPNCGQHLRVPRGKGKITVTCRSCGASFQEKS